MFESELGKTAQLIVEDCSIETDLEIVIPEEYVSNISERLSLYSQLDNIKDENALLDFSNSLKDRFGVLPESVNDLIETVRIRWMAEKLGFEKLLLKNTKLKAYFTNPDNTSYYNSEVFGKILQFVQKHPTICNMKEYKNKPIMTVEGINSVDIAKVTLLEMLK